MKDEWWIMNKFLLFGNKFLIEIDSRKPRFFYGTCGPFTKNKEQIKKNLMEQMIFDIF